MVDLQHMFTWAVKVDDTAALLRTALERVDQVGGASAAAECAAALDAANAIPRPHPAQPELQVSATVRLIGAVEALAKIPPPGVGDPKLRAVHLAEIECAMHAAASRAQAARFAAFASDVGFPGPLQPALIAWSCHWDAMAYHHEALGRLVAGVDRDSVDGALAQGLAGAVETMATWVATTETVYGEFMGPNAQTEELQPELKRSFETFAETIAVDRETLAEWSKIVANPEWLVQPPGRATIARLVDLDRRRASLHSARMEVAVRFAPKAATN